MESPASVSFRVEYYRQPVIQANSLEEWAGISSKGDYLRHARQACLTAFTHRGSLGNERQGYIVLPKGHRARSERHLPFHARDRDFVQHANRGQKPPDVQAIEVSRHGLTTSFREIQPALSLSCFPGASALGTILCRDSAQPCVLQVGTPSFGSSHCVRAT
jgi:hypothetical protein